MPPGDEGRRLAEDYVGSTDAATYGLRPLSDAGGINAPPPPPAPGGGWMQTARDYLDPLGTAGKAVKAAGSVGDPELALHRAVQPGPYVPPPVAAPAAAAPVAQQPAPDPTRGGYQLPRPQVVGAAWNPGTHTVETKHGMPVPEAAKNAADAGAGLDIGAAEQRRDVAVQAGEAQADYARGQRARAELHAIEADRNAQKRDEYVNQSMQRQAELSNDIRATKIDPEAYFKEKGTAGQAMSVVALMLGGFGGALSGQGGNGALTMMNAAIDRNIKAQEANLATKKGSLADEQSIFQRNLEAFGTPEKARAASKIAYLELGQSMLDQRNAQLKTPEAEALYTEASARVQKEIAKYKTDFAKLEHDDVTESMNEKFTPAHLVGGGAGTKQNPALYVPLAGGYARDEQTARKLNETGGMRMQLDSNITKAIELKNKARATHNPIDLYQISKELDALAADSDTKKTVLEAQGAMSKDDKANTEESIGNMRGVIGPLNTHIKGLKSAQERNLEHQRLAFEANGIKRGEAQYVQGANGPEERAVLEGQNRMPSSPSVGVDDKIKPLGGR